MRDTLFFLGNTLFTAALITGAATISKRNPVLAGFITALPLSTILALSLSHLQTGSSENTARYAASILVALVVCLPFFLPFLVYGKVKGNFWLYMACGIGLLFVGFLLQRVVAARLIGA